MHSFGVCAVKFGKGVKDWVQREGTFLVEAYVGRWEDACVCALTWRHIYKSYMFFSSIQCMCRSLLMAHVSVYVVFE